MIKLPRVPRPILVTAAVLAVLIVYAFGFQVTRVNLTEIGSPRRQASLVRILRAIAQPPIIEYDQVQVPIERPLYSPCPAEPVELPEPDPDEAHLRIEPPCGGQGEQVLVQGFNLPSNTRGPINMIPPSGVVLQLGTFETDVEGHFETLVRLPNRSSDEPNMVQAITRRNVGAPRFTQTARDTWDKIVETVFIALLATTLGTILAVPGSFLAARNIMKGVTSPLIGLALSILGAPLGIVLGGWLAGRIGALQAGLAASTAVQVPALAASLGAAVAALRFSMPAEEASAPPGPGLRLARLTATLAAGLLGLFGLFVLADLARTAGSAVAPSLGGFAFMGTFVRDLGEILDLSIVALSAVAVGAIVANLGGKVGTEVARRTGRGLRMGLGVVLAVLAGALLTALIGLALNWLYQFGSVSGVALSWAPVGAALGLALAVFYPRRDNIPVGMAVYYIARTVFNALRSIEALIMVIVFVVWVGVGPFAGLLALSLHTVAALAKLYSEQVESILPGPIEAVAATGANRLQTIIYAVIPQIIPPYISFTMYRWDINVRMSTIIGFAGGGGIGFLLQQNINLLNYRAAAAQMLAIAIVVATMDYVSSTLRERYV